MTENLEEKVPATLEGVCPSCKKEARFEYTGPMTGLEVNIETYRCSVGACTIAYETFLERNPQPTVSSR